MPCVFSMRFFMRAATDGLCTCGNCQHSPCCRLALLKGDGGRACKCGRRGGWVRPGGHGASWALLLAAPGGLCKGVGWGPGRAAGQAPPQRQLPSDGKVAQGGGKEAALHWLVVCAQTRVDPHPFQTAKGGALLGMKQQRQGPRDAAALIGCCNQGSP